MTSNLKYTLWLSCTWLYFKGDFFYHQKGRSSRAGTAYQLQPTLNSSPPNADHSEGQKVNLTEVK